MYPLFNCVVFSWTNRFCNERGEYRVPVPHLLQMPRRLTQKRTGTLGPSAVGERLA